ncbi:hypothetical protein N9U04_00450 [Alphaproteobacteria bacterium]|jgi:hypothetical protein|nr:hypothetical protein [Alphaproteobacteria bacterium]
MTWNNYFFISLALLLSSTFSNSSNALDLTDFQSKLEQSNNLADISASSPEGIFLESLNHIVDTISSKTLSLEEIEQGLTLVSSLDLIEASLPKEAIISFDDDFLIGADLSYNDLMNASYFLNSLNAQKLQQMKDIGGLVNKDNSIIANIQRKIISLGNSNVPDIISKLEAMPEIDLASLSSQISSSSQSISQAVGQAEVSVNQSLSETSNELSGVASQINSATQTLSFAAGAAMAAAALSLDDAAQRISNAVASGVAIDLNAASQGMGYSDFSSAVDAYNSQYGTSYTVDSAREALGQ